MVCFSMAMHGERDLKGRGLEKDENADEGIDRIMDAKRTEDLPQISRSSKIEDNWKADQETRPEKTQMSTYTTFTSKSRIFPFSLYSSMALT